MLTHIIIHPVYAKCCKEVKDGRFTNDLYKNFPSQDKIYVPEFVNL